MIYEYKCNACTHVFDVSKPVAEMDRQENCPLCQAAAMRQFTPRVHFIGAKVEHAEFNPGLGCVVKGKKHREELCKRRNLIEVGSEKADSISQSFEKDREAKKEARYEQAFQEARAIVNG